MKTYKIIRMFKDHFGHQTIERGLTLEEAQAHCSSPETSSSSATSVTALALTASKGPWFDGYDGE
mgnify:CR=1 FL=1